ncbi:MAG: LEVG family PEP-CTERM protein [Cyanobacteria bacterium P01_A01_bin.84]
MVTKNQPEKLFNNSKNKNIKEKIMTNFKILGKVLAVSTVALSVFVTAGSANAQSFVPQQEGEVKLTNLNCLTGNCIETENNYGFKVTSLDYFQDLTDGNGQPLANSNKYGKSLLFVDQKGTANDYGFGIKFKANDAGTNPITEAFWLRPLGMDKDGNPIEGGELEVGRFLFEFVNPVASLDLDFLDVEEDKFPFSSILKVNGNNNFAQSLEKGPDDNIQTVKLKNVSSFVVQLGNPGVNSDIFKKTGDGVNLQVAKTPEPTVTFSLAALAIAGMFGAKKRRNSAKGA